MSTIYGGIIISLGVGLIIRWGGSLDGTEVLAIIADRRTPFSVGETIMFFNLFILGSSGFVFSWDSAMYSLVAYFIAYKMIDVVTNGLDEMKGMLIVTGKHDQVTDCLTRDMGRAVTLINGEGAYKREKTMILYCVVSRLEVTRSAMPLPVSTPMLSSRSLISAKRTAACLKDIKCMGKKSKKA